MQYDYPDPVCIYYCAPEGLKIIPTPGGIEETIQFKWYAKRKWWQFWKPTWYAITYVGEK